MAKSASQLGVAESQLYKLAGKSAREADTGGSRSAISDGERPPEMSIVSTRRGAGHCKKGGRSTSPRNPGEVRVYEITSNGV